MDNFFDGFQKVVLAKVKPKCTKYDKRPECRLGYLTDYGHTRFTSTIPGRSGGMGGNGGNGGAGAGGASGSSGGGGGS